MRAHAQSRVGVGVGDSEHNPLMVAPETLGSSHASRGTRHSWIGGPVSTPHTKLTVQWKSISKFGTESTCTYIQLLLQTLAVNESVYEYV